MNKMYVAIVAGLAIGVAVASMSPGNGAQGDFSSTPNAAAPAMTKIGAADQLSQEQRDRKVFLENIKADNQDELAHGTIDPLAIEPYTLADYPETVKKFGDLVPTINSARKNAAKIAAKDARCDGVTNAQITSHSTTSDRHYWVECNNVSRFYFDEDSIARGKPSHVQTVDDMGRDGLLDW